MRYINIEDTGREEHHNGSSNRLQVGCSNETPPGFHLSYCLFILYTHLYIFRFLALCIMIMMPVSTSMARCQDCGKSGLEEHIAL